MCYQITKEKSSNGLLVAVLAVLFVAVSVCFAVKLVDSRQAQAASESRYEELYGKYSQLSAKVRSLETETERNTRYFMGKK